MRKEPVAFEDWSGHIIRQLRQGILLSTARDGRWNTMTIGWGTLGIEWGKPVFITYVRDSRYTKEALDQTGEFTINVPLPSQDVRKILGVCGTRSGRDLDKFKELELLGVPGSTVQAPAIAQLPLTLECKIIYAQKQEKENIGQEIKDRYYPADDYHTAYYGLITDAYILKED